MPSATLLKKNKYIGIVNFFSKGHMPIEINSVLDAPKDNKINKKKNKKKVFIKWLLFS